MPSNAPTVYNAPAESGTHKTEHSYEGAVRATLLKLGANDPEADIAATGEFWRHAMAAGIGAETAAAVIYSTARHRHAGTSTLKEASEAPTREEWEVIARRSGPMEKLLNAAGRKATAVEGNLVIFGDFYDDETARAFAQRLTKAGYIVTYGPHKMPEAAEVGLCEGDPSAMEVAPVVSEAKGNIPYTKVERNPKAHETAMELAAKYGPIGSPQKVYELLGEDFAKEDSEIFVVIPVNLRGELKSIPYEIARGQRSHVAVGVNDVMRAVLDSGCEGFYCAHSHPSGRCTPSKADRDLTAQIKAATLPFGREVKYLDHFVVGTRSIYSIEEGKAYPIK
jgi:proteasome lid subunit RPN8/RPN11